MVPGTEGMQHTTYRHRMPCRELEKWGEAPRFARSEPVAAAGPEAPGFSFIPRLKKDASHTDRVHPQLPIAGKQCLDLCGRRFNGRVMEEAQFHMTGQLSPDVCDRRQKTRGAANQPECRVWIINCADGYIRQGAVQVMTSDAESGFPGALVYAIKNDDGTQVNVGLYKRLLDL